MAMAMARHHLLPFTLALIISLLIIILLPSSSHAAQTDALFSEDNDILLAGDALSHGDLRLYLDYDCGLVLYHGDNIAKDFGTRDNTSKNCELRLNHYGELILNGNGNGLITYPRTVPSDQLPGVRGYYGLLFVGDQLGIFGPSFWDNGVRSNSRWGLEHRSLKSVSSADNFIISSERIDGNANGDVIIAQNEKVTAYLTAHCTLSVKGDDGTIWQTDTPTDNATACVLWLAQNGAFLLQHDDKELVTQWTGGHLKDNNDYVGVLLRSGELIIFPPFSIFWPLSSSSSAAATVGQKIKMVTG